MSKKEIQSSISKAHFGDVADPLGEWTEVVIPSGRLAYTKIGDSSAKVTFAPNQGFDGQKARNSQVGGDHYVSMGIQPWDAMEAWMTPEEFGGFLRGNAIKYLARCRVKGAALEDVKKAQHYLTKLIDVMENTA